MKKKILVFVALFAVMTSIHAASNLTVSPVTIPQGGTGTIDIQLNNDKAYTAFTLKLTLPEGISYDSFTKGSRFAESHSVSAIPSGQNISFGCLSTSNESISGNSGTLISVNLTVDASLAVGSTHTAVLSNVTFSTTSGEEILSDVNISITIGDNRTVLDENSTIAPVAESGANVLVRRTISANTWSTICLPFAMSEAQVKAAFGEDVELADFTGYKVTEEEDEIITAITVNFNDLTAIEANHPCLIKVSEPVEEFTVDSVDIDPEDEPVVAAVRRTRKQWSELIGTYVANTEVPEKTLFLNGNKFWYSTGATKMKAFRAYFDFYDVLTEVDEAYAKVRFIVNGESTAIEGIASEDYGADDKVYSVSGVYVGTADKLNSLPAGLYIVNGTKVMVK